MFCHYCITQVWCHITPCYILYTRIFVRNSLVANKKADVLTRLDRCWVFLVMWILYKLGYVLYVSAPCLLMSTDTDFVFTCSLLARQSVLQRVCWRYSKCISPLCFCFDYRDCKSFWVAALRDICRDNSIFWATDVSTSPNNERRGTVQ